MSKGMASSSSPSPPTQRLGNVARRWSSEKVLGDFREIQATSMGVSRSDSGQYALLGKTSDLIGGHYHCLT